MAKKTRKTDLKTSMTLKSLLTIADKAFGEAVEPPETKDKTGHLLGYWDERQPGTIRDDHVFGATDSLAHFVICELVETYDASANRAEQLATALRVIVRAQDDLGAVSDALRSAE